jgi:hypothetical protein
MQNVENWMIASGTIVVLGVLIWAVLAIDRAEDKRRNDR